VSPDHPVVITKFISGAREIDVDAVACKGELLIHAVSEHVENAGVHSGDATLVLPPISLDDNIMARLKDISQKVANGWQITGPFNMQIIKAENPDDPSRPLLKVIECNLRASRSFPFVSKVLGINFIDVATRALVGKGVPKTRDPMAEPRPYTAVKVPQFSWTRLAGADPYLGVEMSSTGEVACFGKDVKEAYWAAIQSTQNFRVPQPGHGVLLGGDEKGEELQHVANILSGLGYKLYTSSETVKGALEATGITVTVIEFPKTDKRKLREVFQKYEIDAVINLARERGRDTLDEDYVMRRNSVDFNVPLVNDPKVREIGSFLVTLLI
jgi:carbamoyl-phosphate synthase large subunit